jgi:hypothetical protein
LARFINWFKSKGPSTRTNWVYRPLSQSKSTFKSCSYDTLSNSNNSTSELYLWHIYTSAEDSSIS